MKNYRYCWFCFAPRNIPTNCELLHIYPACLCMDPTMNTFFFFFWKCLSLLPKFLCFRAKTWMTQHLKASYKLWQCANHCSNRFSSRTLQGSHYFYSKWCFFEKHSVSINLPHQITDMQHSCKVKEKLQQANKYLIQHMTEIQCMLADRSQNFLSIAAILHNYDPSRIIRWSLSYNEDY